MNYYYNLRTKYILMSEHVHYFVGLQVDMQTIIGYF